MVLRLDELWGYNPRPAVSLVPYLYTSGKQPRATSRARVLGPTARSQSAQGGTLQFHVLDEIDRKVAHRDRLVPASPFVPSSGPEGHSAGRNLKKTVTCRAKSKGSPGMSPMKLGRRTTEWTASKRTTTTPERKRRGEQTASQSRAAMWK